MIDTNIDSLGFNSYATVDELNNYAEARGITLNGKPEHLLIRAMDYLESKEYSGSRMEASQPLSFPRVGIDGVDINSIPRQIITAQLILAIEADKGDLMPSQHEPQVVSESLGSMSTTFAVNSDGFKKKFPAVDELLKPFMNKVSFGSATITRG